MNLIVEVGTLARKKAENTNDLKDLNLVFENLNDVLFKNQLPEVFEPENMNPEERLRFEMHGFDELHYLRRFAAYISETGSIPAEPGNEDASEDKILAKYFRNYFKIHTKQSLLTRLFSRKEVIKPRFSHIIVHSDSEGFYVPLAFEDVILTNEKVIPGGMIGSSYRLKDECEELARHLELNLNIHPDSDEIKSLIQSHGKSEIKWRHFGIESFTCIRLYHAALKSIELHSCITFS